MSKVHVEWGRISPAQPKAAPVAGGQITLATLSDAFRLALHLAHTMTESQQRDAGTFAALMDATRRGYNSAYKANHRAVFWADGQDWFVSVTNLDKHAHDGGYAHTAARIMKTARATA